jgi:hypothetical protein
MDLSTYAAPKSDQMNAEDLLSGPLTLTIKAVRKTGSEQQPVAVSFEEFPRPWKPSTTAIRVMIAGWGREADAYPGRRLTLFRDPSVKWAGEPIGGIRISHMSHLKDGKRFALYLAESQKKRTPTVIEPLPDNAPASAPVDEATVARNSLLNQVKAAAERAGVDLATIAAEWAESHDGQAIKDTSDVGGLELLRDDLQARAGA